MSITTLHYDAFVLGAGTSGVAAAVTLAEMGASVLLADRNGYVGGTATLGIPMLAFLDVNGRQVTGGFAQRMVDELRRAGACMPHRRCPINHSVTVYNPEMYKLIALQMLQKANVHLLLECELEAVACQNRTVTCVTLLGKGNRVNVNASLVLDCTGDGDLAHMAGCACEMGQEDTGELMPPTVMFAVRHFDESRFFDYLDQHPEQMSYGDRQEGEGYGVPYFREDRNYVFGGFHKLLSELRAKGECPVDRDTLIYINGFAPGEAYINTIRLLHTNACDIFERTNAQVKGFSQILPILAMLKTHVPGFEACSLSFVAPMLGVRETRRVCGISRLTAERIIAGDIPGDTVALGSYKIDIPASDDSTTQFTNIDRPFGIPYGCVVARDLDNMLMAGRNISVDARVLGATRVMPTCIALGEAAGVAGALALRQKIAPALVSPQEIRRVLLARGAILD